MAIIGYFADCGRFTEQQADGSWIVRHTADCAAGGHAVSALIAAAAVSAGGACWAAAFAGPVWVVGKLNDRAALRRDIAEMLAGAEAYANGEHRRPR